MTTLIKSIHKYEDKFEKKAERFTFHHPYFAFFALFIGGTHFYFDCCCGRHHSDCLATFPYFRLGLTSLWQLYGK